MAKDKELSSPQQNQAENKRLALLDAEAKESQTLTLIAKRLRAAKKKVKRAEEIEAIKAGGKDINADQEEAIRSKVKNLATIEELERLFPLLKESVNQDINEKLAQKTTEIELKAKEVASIEIAEQAKTLAEANEIERSKANALSEDLKLKAQEALADKQAFEDHRAQTQAEHESKISELQSASKLETELAVSRILQLFYFSRLFSKEGFSNDYVPTTERNACLSYDQNLEPTDEVLTERDLEDICTFGKHISSRPPSDIISHKRALDQCYALANDWVTGAETSLPFLSASVNDLVTKFERILGSDYFTVQPREVAPEPKSSQTQPQFHPEPIQNARSGHLTGQYNIPASFSSGGHGQGVQTNQAQNGHILPHFLAPRPGQVSHDRQLPDQAVVSFMPPLNSSSISQQASGNLGQGVPNPSGPSFPSTTNHQPPGFEVGGKKSSGHIEGNIGPALQFNNQSYQGTQFGGISTPELAIGTAQQNPNVAQSQSQSQGTNALPSFTPLHDNIPSTSVQPSTNKSSTEADTIPKAEQGKEAPKENFSESSGTDAKTTTFNPNAGRQQRTPQEQYRGRGPPRGRGRGGDYVNRGGPGRRAYNPNRGGRNGRGGRDYVPQQAYQAAAY